MRLPRQVLPSGTAAVGGGLGVLGLASYGYLAIAGHGLDPAAMSSVAVLWSFVFAVGPGLFLPIEQEITRIAAARRVGGDGARPVVRRGAILASAVLAALLAALAVAGRPLADRLFAGEIGMVWALGGAFAGLAAAHTVHGVLAGAGRFGWYGAQLGIDGALRIVLAGLLLLAGVSSPVWFGLVLALAPAASALLTLPPVLTAAAPGGPIGWADLSRGLGLLTISALLAQAMINVAVVNVRLLAPREAALAGAMLAAMVLVRAPVFVFASLQAALLPGLSGAAAAGDRRLYLRLLVRALAAVTVLAAIGGVACVAFGPALAVGLFDSPDLLGRLDFAWLAAGTMAFLVALVLGQAVLAIGRHRELTAAWLAGIAVLAGVTLIPGQVALRVELAYAAAAAAVAGALTLALLRRLPAHWAGGSSPRPAAAGARR